MITLTIPGAPPSSQEKNIGRRNGKTYVWQSDAHEAYMTVARAQVRRQWGRRPVVPKGKPVIVNLYAWYPVPKSWRKAERDAAHEAFKCSHPDGDNLAKTVGDALGGIICENDASIQWGCVHRRWSAGADDAWVAVEVILVGEAAAAPQDRSEAPRTPRSPRTAPRKAK